MAGKGSRGGIRALGNVCPVCNDNNIVNETGRCLYVTNSAVVKEGNAVGGPVFMRRRF